MEDGDTTIFGPTTGDGDSRQNARYKWIGVLKNCYNVSEAIAAIEDMGTDEERGPAAQQIFTYLETYTTKINTFSAENVDRLQASFADPGKYHSLTLEGKKMEDKYPATANAYKNGKNFAIERAKLDKNLMNNWKLSPEDFPFYNWTTANMSRIKEVSAFVNRDVNRVPTEGIARLSKNFVWRFQQKATSSGPSGDDLSPSSADFTTKSQVYRNKGEVEQIDLRDIKVQNMLKDNNKHVNPNGFIIDGLALPEPLQIESRAGSDLADSQPAPGGQLAANPDLASATAAPAQTSQHNQDQTPPPNNNNTNNNNDDATPPRYDTPSSGLGTPDDEGSVQKGLLREIDRTGKGGIASTIRPKERDHDTFVPALGDDSALSSQDEDSMATLHEVCTQCMYAPAKDFVESLDRSNTTAGRIKPASQESLDIIIHPYQALVTLFEKSIPAAERKGVRSIPVCLKHFKLTLASVGLRTNFPIIDGRQRLRQVAGLCTYEQDVVKWIQSDPDLFTAKVLPKKFLDARNALGPYRFFPATHLESISECLTKEQAAHLLKISGLSESIGKLREDGSVIIEGLFDWLIASDETDRKDGIVSLYDLIGEEMDLYRWHQRRIGNKHNLGWLRNMIHSCTQQLVRQDIMYWVAYTLAREDHRYQMVSYPYYAKYQHPAEGNLEDNLSTSGFRHIDLNPGCIATDPNRSQIQGSVSFDNEADDDCTEMVLGMHKQEKIDLWVKRMRSRGVLNDANLIMVIDDQKLSKEDLKILGLKWAPQPCPAFGVRLSYPHIPHGALPGKGVRRTVLPWFSGLHGDHIDHPEAGTWEQFSVAHRDLVPGPSSPSSYTNKYAIVPYAFPAAVRLSGNGNLSDALVAQTRWSSPGVQQELRALLALDKDGFQRALDIHRANMATNFRIAFDQVKAIELEQFPITGYIANKGDLSKLPDPDQFQWEDSLDEREMSEDENYAMALGHYDRPAKDDEEGADGSVYGSSGDFNGEFE